MNDLINHLVYELHRWLNPKEKRLSVSAHTKPFRKPIFLQSVIKKTIEHTIDRAAFIRTLECHSNIHGLSEMIEICTVHLMHFNYKKEF